MFIKRKKNRSGTTSVVVAEKTKGIYKELITIGVAKDSNEIDSLVNAGHEWIFKEKYVCEKLHLLNNLSIFVAITKTTLLCL